MKTGDVHERTELSEYYCARCGYPVTDHDSYCRECGGAFRKGLADETCDRDALLELADICESTGDMYDSCRSEAVDGALVGLLRETTEFELKDGPYRLKDCPYHPRCAGGEPMDENHFANLIIALAAVSVIGFVVIVLAIYATA